MKNLLLLISVTIIARLSLGQHKSDAVLIIPIKHKNSRTMIGASNPENQTNLLFNYGDFDTRYYTVFNKDYEIINAVKAGKRITDEKPLAIQYSTGSYFLYMGFSKSSYIKDELIVHKINATGTGINQEKLLLPIEKKDVFLASVNDQNQFFLLYLNKKSNSLLAIKLLEGKISSSHRFTLTEDDLSLLKKKGDFEEIKLTSETSLFKSTEQRKIYLKEKDLLLLTIEHNGFDTFGMTRLIEIDYNGQKLTGKSIDNPTAQSSFDESNTFTLKDRVFKITLKRDALDFTIYDYTSLRVVKKYYYKKEDEIDIVKGNVIKEGAASIWENDTDVLFKTAKILRKLNKGVAGITVNPITDKEYAIQIGSYYVPNNGGGGMMMMPGGTMGVGPGGSIPIATAIWVGGGGFDFYSKGSGVTTYFNTFIEPQSGEVTSRLKYIRKIDEIDDFLEVLDDRKVKIAKSTVFKGEHGQVLVAFISKKDKEIQFYSF